MEEIIKISHEYEENAALVFKTTNWIKETEKMSLNLNILKQISSEILTKFLKKNQNHSSLLKEKNENQDKISISPTTLHETILKKTLEDDLKSSKEIAIELINRSLSKLTHFICKKYKSCDYKIDYLEIIEKIQLTNKKNFQIFFLRFDKTENYFNFITKILFYFTAFIEKLKNHWIEFYTNDYYNFVDSGEFNEEIIQDFMIKKIKLIFIKEFHWIDNLLKQKIFSKNWFEIQKLNKQNYHLITKYYHKVRFQTRRKLKKLENMLHNSRFLTKHVVVSSVYRLRFELRQSNEESYSKFQFLWSVEKSLMKSFWREAVLNFDKDFLKEEWEFKEKIVIKYIYFF